MRLPVKLKRIEFPRDVDGRRIVQDGSELTLGKLREQLVAVTKKQLDVGQVEQLTRPRILFGHFSGSRIDLNCHDFTREPCSFDGSVAEPCRRIEDASVHLAECAHHLKSTSLWRHI